MSSFFKQSSGGPREQQRRREEVSSSSLDILLSSSFFILILLGIVRHLTLSVSYYITSNRIFLQICSTPCEANDGVGVKV